MAIVNDPVSVYILVVFGVFLLLLGTVGNITSLIVLSRRALDRLKIRPYLMALAVFDLLVLYLILLPTEIIIPQGRKAKPIKAIQCKLMMYINFFVIDCSSWITVTITFERLLYIVRPHMIRPKRCTAIVLASIICLLAVINIPIASRWTSVDGKCYADKVYYMINFTINSYIPASIMVVSNIFMIYTLCRRPTIGSNVTTKRNNSIGITVAINLVFLSTTFPVTVVWLITENLYLPLYVLCYANYAINFIMYIIAGQIFREELKSMLCGCNCVRCRKSDTSTPSSVDAAGRVSITDTSV